MELSIKMITVSVSVVVLLVVLSFFITTQASGQISASDANRVFSTYCQNYKLNGCSWDVTKSAGFDEFLGACRSIYGSESEAYSCLYVSCPACSKGDIGDTDQGNGLRCASLCEQCRADTEISVKSTCCQQFAMSCSGSGVSCRDICP